MKKILVTGAAGTIGHLVVKKLLEQEKYEITALDLKSNKAVKRFKVYKNKINIIYGDISDSVLMRSLIKDHDVIIHLAGVIPPFADIKQELSKSIDYDGTKNIIEQIKIINPDCFLIFASTTCVYGRVDDNLELNVQSPVIVLEDDIFALTKLRCEETIKKELNNYTIFRLPAVFNDLRVDAPMYNIPLSSEVEFITALDAATAFVNAVAKKRSVNKKIFNVVGGEKMRVNFRHFVIYILKHYGLSFRYFVTMFLVDKNFYSGWYSDGDVANKILNFQSDTLDTYYKFIKRRSGKRVVQRIMAKPFIWMIKKNKKI